MGMAPTRRLLLFIRTSQAPLLLSLSSSSFHPTGYSPFKKKKLFSFWSVCKCECARDRYDSPKHSALWSSFLHERRILPECVVLSLRILTSCITWGIISSFCLHEKLLNYTFPQKSSKKMERSTSSSCSCSTLTVVGCLLFLSSVVLRPAYPLPALRGKSSMVTFFHCY